MKFICLIIPLFLMGCSAARPIADVAAAGGGGYLANDLSHGDPAITAAGAAGGVVVSESAFYLSKKQSDKAYVNGYEKGRSDAVKQQYWLQVNQQRASPQRDDVRFYEIPVPEQTIDGVILKPTNKYLRIEE
jgi:hypothetical protein